MYEQEMINLFLLGSVIGVNSNQYVYVSCCAHITAAVRVFNSKRHSSLLI